jgi:hypothetical protein
MVVGAQPKPLTYAFWGFGMLGLLVGYVLTFPMNWMMVKVGWKHGMGPKEGAHPVASRPAKVGLVAAMAVLGIAALVLPAWLTEVREGAACPAPSADLAGGARRSIASARDALDAGARTRATRALDDVRRIVTVGANAAPEIGFDAATDEVARARAALQRGDEAGAKRHLARAEAAIHAPTVARAPDEDVRRYVGATAVDDEGRIVGEVVGASGETVTVEVGSWRDVWGFVDLARGRRVEVPIDAVDLGPRRAVGMTLIAVHGPIACTLSARSGAPRPRSARSGG